MCRYIPKTTDTIFSLNLVGFSLHRIKNCKKSLSLRPLMVLYTTVCPSYLTNITKLTPCCIQLCLPYLNTIQPRQMPKMADRFSFSFNSWPISLKFHGFVGRKAASSIELSFLKMTNLKWSRKGNLIFCHVMFPSRVNVATRIVWHAHAHAHLWDNSETKRNSRGNQLQLWNLFTPPISTCTYVTVDGQKQYL